MLLWIQFYKLDVDLITLPLPELGKVAENHQKQLTLIIVTESAKINHMSTNYTELYFR